MSDYILLPQSEGKPILWEYCRPESDSDNVVSIPQSNGIPIIAKCPTPTTEGENVIAVPQHDGKYIICGKCGADRCVYDNKIAYLGYAEIDVPDGGVYLEDIAALNTWMLSSDNYHSIIMVSGSITIDAAIAVPSASAYKFIGENNAKFINENADIQEIVSSGNCPCLIFQNIEFYTTVNYILDDVKGKAYADGILYTRRGYVVNMTGETIYPGYVCKFVVDGYYTRLYKPDENNLENIGVYTSELAPGAQARSDSGVFLTGGGISQMLDIPISQTVNVGQFLSSKADSWQFEVSDTSGTFFIYDDNEDDTYDLVREQTYLARFINCTFSYIKTDSDISIFRDVSYTDFINCDFSGMESDNEYDLTIGIGNFGSFSGCDFTGCVGSKNLTISAYIIDDCDFTNCISGYGVEDGNTTLTIHTATYTGGRIINQTINLTAHDSSGSARHGNHINIYAYIYVNSDISTIASDGVGYWDNAPTRYECGNGGNCRFYDPSYIVNTSISGIGGDGEDAPIDYACLYGGDGGNGAYNTNWDESKYIINSTVYGVGGNGGRGGYGQDCGYYSRPCKGGDGGNGQTVAGIGGAGGTPTIAGADAGNGGDGGNSIDGNGGDGGDGGDGADATTNIGGNGGSGGNGGNSKHGNGGRGGDGGDAGDNGDGDWGFYTYGNIGGSGGSGGSSVNGNGGRGGDGGDGGDSYQGIGFQGSGSGGWGGSGGSSTNGNGGRGGDGGNAGVQKSGCRTDDSGPGSGGWGGNGGNSTTAYGGDGGDGGEAPTPIEYPECTVYDGYGGCGGTGLLGDGTDGTPENPECEE